MAARLQDNASSVQLMRRKAFNRVAEDCKNPPKPPAALIELFAKHK